MDSRNRMDCGERIRTSAANSLDKWVNASGPTTVHECSYPSTMANKLRWIQNESKPQRTGTRPEKHWKPRVREQSRHDEAWSKRSSPKPCLWSSPRPKSTKHRPGSQCRHIKRSDPGRHNSWDQPRYPAQNPANYCWLRGTQHRHPRHTRTSTHFNRAHQLSTIRWLDTGSYYIISRVPWRSPSVQQKNCTTRHCHRPQIWPHHRHTYQW